MAYVYGQAAGASGKQYRAYLEYSVSQTETTYTVTGTGGIQAIDAISYQNVPASGIYWYLNGAWSWMSGVNADTYMKQAPITLAKNAYLKMFDISHTYSKTSASSSEQVSQKVGIALSIGSYASTATVNVTVPALKSYQVTFNANGGTGAPSAQTKYYGRTLIVSTTKPTRTGYRFVSWNTKSDGTGTAYASGGSYTANAAVTLYAVWEWVYVPHKISNLSAVRCDSTGTASDTGAYAKVTFNWTKAGLESGQVNPSAIKVGYKLSTASTYTYASVSDLTSGTASIIIGGNLTEDNSYDVIAVVSASGHADVTKETYISSSYFCMDISPNGKSIGFGRSAPEDKSGFFCALPPFVDVNTTAGPTTTDGKLTAALDALGWTTAVISNKDLDVKQLLQKILDRLGSPASFSIRSVRKLCSSIDQGVSDQEETVSLPSASYGTPIAVVGYRVGYYHSSYYRQVVVSGFWLDSSGAVFSLSNPFTSGTGQFYLTAYYLMI